MVFVEFRRALVGSSRFFCGLLPGSALSATNTVQSAACLPIKPFLPPKIRPRKYMFRAILVFFRRVFRISRPRNTQRAQPGGILASCPQFHIPDRRLVGGIVPVVPALRMNMFIHQAINKHGLRILPPRAPQVYRSFRNARFRRQENNRGRRSRAAAPAASTLPLYSRRRSLHERGCGFRKPRTPPPLRRR